MNRNNTGVALLDRNNKPFYTFYQAKTATIVPLNKISDYLEKAVIASEDKDFYTHPGFSIKSMARSLVWDIQEGGAKYGGSTITQQLVKNSLLNSKRNFLRKYQELVLAQELERRYSKEEILEMYLNSAYFGEGAFGAEEAAKRYFDKTAAQLTVGESAYLASLLPSPSALSPSNSSMEEVKSRQEIILRKMAEQGYINEGEKETAKIQKLTFSKEPLDINQTATHFALMVRDQLIKEYGEEYVSRSGFRVKTTLNIAWQEKAEEVVRAQVKNLARNRVSNGAAVVQNPKTGEILALVGSHDWYDEKYGKFNVATALRQPGSSFKPIVYIAGFEKKVITPGTVLKDQPVTYKNPWETYSPKNYDNKFRGPVLPRRALANSLNVPAVETLDRVGLPTALDMAKRLGINSLKDPSNYGLSLVLGSGEVQLLEMTNAYSVFANNGIKNDPTLILEITDKYNNNLYTYSPRNERVISPEYTFLISSILSDNKARQEVFGSALTISRPAAVKTGTTENYKDAWTLGYTPSLAIGVWVGNNDGTPMDTVAGSLGAAPIWRSLMESFLQGTPVERFTPPEGVVGVSVCPNNGLRLREASSSAYTEYFVTGTEPKQFCIIQSPNPPSGTPAPTGSKPEDKKPEESSGGDGSRGQDKKEEKKNE